jgi:hypothetical protein
MTATIATIAPVAPAKPAHETFGQRVGDLLHHGEQDAAALAARIPGIETDIRDHAGQVFDVASTALNIAKMINPADAAAVTAIEAFVGKVLGLAQSAAKIAGAVTSPGSKTA